MSRLIVVSNRVSLPKDVRAGGLASALHAALIERGGLWFGWSGRTIEDDDERTIRTEREGKLEYTLVDLTRHEVDGYYAGFANRTLWPLLHFRPSLLEYKRAEFETYRGVNRMFAEHIAPLVRDDDLVWIHDYHLIPLAAELRERGVGARIGFFLHIPLPPPELLINLPCHRELIATLSACDLVGVQHRDDARALFDYFARRLGGTRSRDVVELGGRRTHIAPFPISIDTAEVARQSRYAINNSTVRKLRASLNDRQLAIGVDRLDYSKGLPRRFEAFGRFLAEHHEWR